MKWIPFLCVLMFMLGFIAGLHCELVKIPPKQNTQQIDPLAQDIALMRDLYAQSKKPRIIWE